MAAGAFVFPDKAKLNFHSATNLLGKSSGYKLALVSSAWTPANSTDEVWADVSANEITTGNGYTAGGVSLLDVEITQTSGTVKFTSSPAVFTASGGSIPAWRRGVIYYSGTANGKVNPIVGHFLGDSAPADIASTTNGNRIVITPDASGIVVAT